MFHGPHKLVMSPPSKKENTLIIFFTVMRKLQDLRDKDPCFRFYQMGAKVISRHFPHCLYPHLEDGTPQLCEQSWGQTGNQMIATRVVPCILQLNSEANLETLHRRGGIPSLFTTFLCTETGDSWGHPTQGWVGISHYFYRNPSFLNKEGVLHLGLCR